MKRIVQIMKIVVFVSLLPCLTFAQGVSKAKEQKKETVAYKNSGFYVGPAVSTIHAMYGAGINALYRMKSPYAFGVNGILGLSPSLEGFGRYYFSSPWTKVLPYVGLGLTYTEPVILDIFVSFGTAFGEAIAGALIYGFTGQKSTQTAPRKSYRSQWLGPSLHVGSDFPLFWNFFLNLDLGASFFANISSDKYNSISPSEIAPIFPTGFLTLKYHF